MKHFAIFHEIQDLLLGWISVANRAIPVNLEFDRRRRFEEVSMPFVFRTARALSALGSLACATVLAAAFVALSIASQTAAAAEATPSETSIEQRIQALVPSLEEYISANMKSFDVPGLARLWRPHQGWGGRGRHSDPFSDRIGDQSVSFHDNGDRGRPGQATLG
jgi:hypothetical protein